MDDGGARKTSITFNLKTNMYDEANAPKEETRRPVEEETRRPVEGELDRLYAAIEFLDRNLSNLSGRLEKISVTMPELLVEDSDVKKETRSDSEITRRIRYIHDYVQKLSERVRGMEDSVQV